MERAYTQDRQGTTPGNLATMCASSPPWESSLNNNPSDQILAGSGGRMGQSCKSDEYYGSTSGQIGNQTGDTFWGAARTIIEQLYLVLKPGAHAIWITKRFIRDGAIVDFSQQWAALCEACGFRVVHWHRAWLVEERGTQYDLDGQANTKKLKRSSFFRRLYESKYPENAIDWEDVICTERM